MTEFLKDLFTNKALLDHALTHKSWVNENQNIRTSNERLEFLGDAILEYVVSKELFKRFTDKEEGFLTALRANLVNTINLASLAQKLELGKKIYLSRGEEEGGGRDNQTILADTIEAIIGALFLDGGIESSENFIQKNILVEVDVKAKEPLKDFKSRLQELVQAKGLQAPKYQVVEEEGPDHNKMFTIEVLIEGKGIGKGSGKSKSTAEQVAAEDALEKIRTNPVKLQDNHD